MKTKDDRQFNSATIIADYLALESAEDRLTWISERPVLHPPFPLERATPQCRVPGCMSGLWLESKNELGNFIFMAHSDSHIVGGIASLLCDLYSGLTSEEIIEQGDLPIQQLKLEGLITPTRRNAIQKVFQFFLYNANLNQAQK
jgi:sulfur transfer protein SufE